MKQQKQLQAGLRALFVQNTTRLSLHWDSWSVNLQIGQFQSFLAGSFTHMALGMTCTQQRGLSGTDTIIDLVGVSRRQCYTSSQNGTNVHSWETCCCWFWVMQGSVQRQLLEKVPCCEQESLLSTLVSDRSNFWRRSYFLGAGHLCWAEFSGRRDCLVCYLTTIVPVLQIKPVILRLYPNSGFSCKVPEICYCLLPL